jgi:3-hydroxyacyl-[acyl-carrier-protein] dehydratase
MWYSLLDLKRWTPTEVQARVTVNGNSPWFSGHFPENPILPGIAQLNMVADVIALAEKDTLYINRLSRVKFKKLVRPGEQLEIHAAATGTDGQYSFRITTHEAQDVCSGMMSLAHKQKTKSP